MPFDAEAIEQFEQDRIEVIAELEALQLDLVAQGQPLESTSMLREHLLHGAARRIGIIKRSIENIFALFPINTVRPLNKGVLDDIHINLHALVINMYGIYDNFAWAYVLRHNLEATIRDRRRISLFHDATRRHLPCEIKTYLESSDTTNWHDSYLKSFRDALAHRIPPYIPPAIFTPEDGQRYNDLDNEMVRCISARQFDRFNEIVNEQNNLGSPCFYFLHAYNETTPPQPMTLHPQILCDGKTVSEFGSIFLRHWQEPPISTCTL